MSIALCAGNAIDVSNVSSESWKELAEKARLPRRLWSEGWIRLRSWGEGLTESQALKELRKLAAVRTCGVLER